MFATPSCGDNATRPIRSLTEPSAAPISPRSNGSDGQLAARHLRKADHRRNRRRQMQGAER